MAAGVSPNGEGGFLLVERERLCPVCGRSGYAAFVEANLDAASFSEATFASRKQPEFMSLRMVRCLTCRTVYAPRPFNEDFLRDAYGASSYDSQDEACHAAKTYAEILDPFLNLLGSRRCAMDVGAGNGALLERLLDAGFAEVAGIEPSRSAMDAANPKVRGMLREGFFTRETAGGRQYDLVCACMTLEHVPDPLEVLRIAFDILAPGGLVAVMDHDWSAPFNRILGRHSPIIDVEHLQLFCPESLRYALKECGFETLSVKHYSNTYKLSYWFRLAPLPAGLKAFAARMIDATGVGELPVKVPVGNMAAIGRKPG